MYYLYGQNRADHSSRGVLLTVVRRGVWSRNLKYEKAVTRIGPQRHKKKGQNPTIYNYTQLYTTQLYIVVFWLYS